MSYKLEYSQRLGIKELIISNKSQGFKYSVIEGYGCALNELIIEANAIHRYATDEETFERIHKQSFSGAHLFPFPNRLDEGRYSWEGIEYMIPINEPNFQTALHGFVFDKEFDFVSFDQHNGSLTMRYHYNGEQTYYPFPFNITVTHRPISNGLRVETIIENSGNTSLPFGYGFHPYFLFEDARSTTFKIPSGESSYFDDRLLPTAKKNVERYREGSVFGTEFFAECFVCKMNSSIEATVSNRDRKISVTANTSYFQVYIPEDGNSVAIEPQTMAINGLQSGEGLTVLDPGKASNFFIDINLVK